MSMQTSTNWDLDMRTNTVVGSWRGLGCLLVLIWSGASTAEAWTSPEQVFGASTVTVQDAEALHRQGAPFIDVRSERQFRNRHIAGAHHLDLKSGFTKEGLRKLVALDQPLVIYCNGTMCGRSSQACELAVEWGYSKVHYFRGGIAEWRRAGLPVESPD